MNDLKEKARSLVDEFKGKNYMYGIGCLERIGKLVAPFGKKVLFITNLHKRDPRSYQIIFNSLADPGSCAERRFQSHKKPLKKRAKGKAHSLK